MEPIVGLFSHRELEPLALGRFSGVFWHLETFPLFESLQLTGAGRSLSLLLVEAAVQHSVPPLSSAALG